MSTDSIPRADRAGERGQSRKRPKICRPEVQQLSSWSVTVSTQAPDSQPGHGARPGHRKAAAPQPPLAGWVGGTKEGADGARSERHAPSCCPPSPWTAWVVIGRGREGQCPHAVQRRRAHRGRDAAQGPTIAVDPIDGTTPTALGRGGALAVIAVSEEGTMFDPGPCVYMEKLAVGPPRRLAPSTSPGPSRTTSKRWPRPRGTSVRGRDRGDPRPPQACGQ